MRVAIAPRYSDYDMQGHVNNAVYLTYFEVARHQAWLALTGQAEDFPFIIHQAFVRYVSQAKWGEPLAVDIRVKEVRTKAWVWGYRMVDTRDERLVAEGETVQVMFDYSAERPMPIPEGLAAVLRQDAAVTGTR